METDQGPPTILVESDVGERQRVGRPELPPVFLEERWGQHHRADAGAVRQGDARPTGDEESPGRREGSRL
jgi:hypothetical protein